MFRVGITSRRYVVLEPLYCGETLQFYDTVTIITTKVGGGKSRRESRRTGGFFQHNFTDQ